MPIAFVQSNKITAALTTNPLPVTLTGVAVGNTIIVAFTAGNSTSTVSVPTDSAGNTYVFDRGPTAFQSGSTGISGVLAIARALVTTGGNITISVSRTAGAGYLFVREYSGISTTSPLRASSSGFSNGSSTASVSPIMTVVNGDLAIGYGYSSSVTFTKNPSYTNIDTVGTTVLTAIQDWVGVTTTSTNASFALSSSTSWDELGVAYIPSAAVTAPTLTGIVSLQGITSLTL